eukprot:COSAG02_NODE_11676_length_1676_cov_1.033608_2_plen_173_part_00
MSNAVPVEAPFGSLVLFHGNVWCVHSEQTAFMVVINPLQSIAAWIGCRHGAYPKVTEGLRVNLTTYYCGSHFKPQEGYHHLDPVRLRCICCAESCVLACFTPNLTTPVVSPNNCDFRLSWHATHRGLLSSCIGLTHGDSKTIVGRLRSKTAIFQMVGSPSWGDRWRTLRSWV